MRRSKRGICYGKMAGWMGGWVGGWVDGWLDVTRRYCIKIAKPILTFFQPSASPIILVSSDACADTQFQEEPLQRGIHGGRKNWRFSTEIAVYLRNGARYADGYYGTLIGSRGCRIHWYHFRWPWVTSNPGFNVTVYKSNISKHTYIHTYKNL